jgi:hypothetical protein
MMKEAALLALSEGMEIGCVQWKVDYSTNGKRGDFIK